MDVDQSTALGVFCAGSTRFVQASLTDYSQTCVKQAPMGKPKIGCLRQVLALYMQISTSLS